MAMTLSSNTLKSLLVSSSPPFTFNKKTQRRPWVDQFGDHLPAIWPKLIHKNQNKYRGLLKILKGFHHYHTLTCCKAATIHGISCLIYVCLRQGGAQSRHVVHYPSSAQCTLNWQAQQQHINQISLWSQVNLQTTKFLISQLERRTKWSFFINKLYHMILLVHESVYLFRLHMIWYPQDRMLLNWYLHELELTQIGNGIVNTPSAFLVFLVCTRESTQMSYRIQSGRHCEGTKEDGLTS